MWSGGGGCQASPAGGGGGGRPAPLRHLGRSVFNGPLLSGSITLRLLNRREDPWGGGGGAGGALGKSSV